MAGYVNIAKGKGLSLGSISFTAISELTRQCFSEHESAFFNQIYEAIDGGGMDMLLLEDLKDAGFNAFYEATKRAYIRCKNSGGEGISPQYIDMVLKSWDELIQLLEQDDRIKG